MRTIATLALAGALAAIPSPSASAATPPGTVWKIRRLEDAMMRLNDVACNTSCQWIAVGENGVIRTTYDPTGSWNLVEISSSLSLQSITWTGTHWVAVGGFSPDNCLVLTSTDGFSWSTWCLGGLPILNCVESVPPDVVALGDLECVATSPDLLGWSTATHGFAKVTDVVWTGSQYVAVGTDGLVKTSPDGSNWTTRASGASSRTDFRAVATNGTKVVAAGYNWTSGSPVIMTSDNGIDWTDIPMTSFPSVQLRAIEWTGTMFVAAGGGGHRFTSTGGTSWANHPAPISWDVYGLHWDGLRLVAVGDGGMVMSAGGSPAATADWTTHQYPHRVHGLNEVAEQIGGSPPRTVVVGDAGTILTSDDDGQSGAEQVSGVGSYLFGVTATSLPAIDFIAVGANGAILTSPDGAAWTTRSSGTTNWLRAVDWFDPAGASPPLAIAAGYDGTILTSPDGITWTPRSSPTTAEIMAVANGIASPSSSQLVVAVGSGGTILTSPDAITWTARTSGTTSRLNGVAALDSGFVAVGNHGVTLTSPDGIVWTPRDAGSNRFFDVCWTGNRLVATGENGVIFTSPDGTDWTRRYGPVSEYLNAVIPLASGRLLAVGAAGIVLSSDEAVDFGDWIAGESPPSGQNGPGDDPNGDDHDNLVAYGFGIPAVAAPTPGELASLPRLIEPGSEKRLKLRFQPRQQDLGDLAYIIENSTTLAADDWTELLRHHPGQPCSSGSLNVMTSDSSPFVSVEFPESYGDSNRYFVRTRLELINPP